MAAEVTVTNRQESRCLVQPNSSVNHHRNVLKWYRICKGGIRYAFKIALSRLSFAVKFGLRKVFWQNLLYRTRNLRRCLRVGQADPHYRLKSGHRLWAVSGYVCQESKPK